MASDLPTEFDVIVLGSGMPESIVAAAFSRIGQAVLHIDRNEYYSGDWASFNLQGIESWTKQFEESSDSACGIERPSIDETSLLQEEESLIQLPLMNCNFSQINLKFHVEEGEDISQPDNAEVKRDVELGHLQSENKSSSTELNPEPVTESELSEVPENLMKTETIETKSVEESSSDNQKYLLNEESEETEATSKQVGEIQNTGDIKEGSDEKRDRDNAICDREKFDKDSEKTGSENESNQVPANAIQSEDTKSAEQEPKKWTAKALKAEWRKFNLDISPKIIYSGGDMVELLISSDIAKYCEFKTVTRILTLLNGELEKVPCSRADVFSSKKVSMIEKRMLMKFLQFCLDFENKAEEIGDFLQRPFREFLDYKKLTANVKHYIQHSIAMATDSTTTEQGLQQMRKFLKSVGRYGNTAFLWSLYGSGELPQSFCRMCAVFGGLYCLRMSASSMIVNKDNKCTGIITTEGQRISCKWLVMENSYAPANFIVSGSKSMLSRAMIMTDKPLLPTDQQEISLMCLPCPDDGNRPVMVLELPPSSLACPRDTYIFHLSRNGCAVAEPQEDLAYAVDKLFRTEEDCSEETDQPSDKPTILWSLYFSQCDMSTIQTTEHVPENVILLSGPGSEIDIDRPVKEAMDVFKKILPDEEFLPKAPNPEDIIYVDDAEAQVAEDSSQSEFKETEDVQSNTNDSSQSEFKETEDIQSNTNDCSQSEFKEIKDVQSNINDQSVNDDQSVTEKEAEDSADMSTDNTQINSKDTDSSNTSVNDRVGAEQ